MKKNSPGNPCCRFCDNDYDTSWTDDFPGTSLHADWTELNGTKVYTSSAGKLKHTAYGQNGIERPFQRGASNNLATVEFTIEQSATIPTLLAGDGIQLRYRFSLNPIPLLPFNTFPYRYFAWYAIVGYGTQSGNSLYQCYGDTFVHTPTATPSSGDVLKITYDESIDQAKFYLNGTLTHTETDAYSGSSNEFHGYDPCDLRNSIRYDVLSYGGVPTATIEAYRAIMLGDDASASVT